MASRGPAQELYLSWACLKPAFEINLERLLEVDTGDLASAICLPLQAA